MKIKNYLYILIISFIGFTTSSASKTFSYAQVHAMPTSIEKDYYIWRLLSQPTTTAAEAKKIIYEASHLNKKLRTSFRARTGQRAPHVSSKEPTIPAHIWKGRSRGNKYFKKGLALLRSGKPQQAANYFDAARKNYIKRYEVDKSLFWLYISTKNKVYLQLLQQSHSPNMYTLLAADTINGTYPETITKRFIKQNTRDFDIKNPIDWAKIKRKMNQSTNSQIDNLANNYASQECIGIYTYLKAKACGHTKSYFPMPYRDVMKRFSPYRQALIYAIARQESRFVPASVSRSFALGMMQFMPFLIEHIAKEKGYRMDLDEIFNPYRAIEFADYHLDYLSRHLYHPLFIAYAYNAGIGFTRRHLRNKHHFRAGAYEPYMSMETMKNTEAREYGKKVLTNYVLYLNKLGVPTRMSSLIQKLTLSN